MILPVLSQIPCLVERGDSNLVSQGPLLLREVHFLLRISQYRKTFPEISLIFGCDYFCTYLSYIFLFFLGLFLFKNLKNVHNL